MRKAILMRTLAKNEGGGENDMPLDSKDMPPAEPMPDFERIEGNLYLFDRRKTRSKKDIKRMVCDCLLTKEERQRNMIGCGEDCLNRMLMIECGSRCPLGDQCSNKRFQTRQYASVEPFYAGKKGWGLRTSKALPPGAFVMEYIGEVVNSDEFKHRVRKYAKHNCVHHYFMALKSDEIIDATKKGNITRFVNHSCDPNCETQKWTVNGELRIGFFTTRVVEAGEEITFDYQFQRYGKEAQKCFCDSPSCRGYIGASEVTTIDLDGSRIAPKQRAKIADIDQKLRSREFEDLALDEEVEKLYEVGSLRNRQQTLTIARLMVRAEDYENRRKLLEVIKSTQEVAYLRLFLDYHGLQLLWSWMADLDDPWLRILVLEVLEVLPVPNKTMLNDSKVLEIVERWSKQTEMPPSLLLPAIIDSRSSSEPSPADQVVSKLPQTEEDECTKASMDSAESEPESKPQLISAAAVEARDSESRDAIDNEVKIEPSEMQSIGIIKEEKPDTDDSAPSAWTSPPDTLPVKSETEEDNAVKQEEAEDTLLEVKSEPLENDVDKLKETDLIDGIVAVAEIAENIKSAKLELGAKIIVKKREKIQPENTVVQETQPEVYVHALRVLNLWKDLKEGFKIPRLVRQKRKDDEKEADEIAREWEERSARGLPVSCNSRRGPDQKDTIASILKARSSKKLYTERRQNGYHNGYNYNTGCTESSAPTTPQPPQEPALPKLSKEEHRREFEKNVIHEEYKAAMKKYEDQLRIYTQLFQNMSWAAGTPANGMPQMPAMPSLDATGQVAYTGGDSSASYAAYWNQTNQFNAVSNGTALPNSADFYSTTAAAAAVPETNGGVPISYEQHPEAATDHTVYDIDTNEIDNELDEAKYKEFAALFNPVPNVKECTATAHQLLSDEAAVLSTDYGIEYVPQNKMPLLRHLEKYPEPGIYYEFDEWAVKLKFDASCSTIEYPEYLEPIDALPELLANVYGPLPRHWRRAVSKKGRHYFYHKKTGETRWTLPVSEGKPAATTHSDSEAQSNIATCDNAEPVLSVEATTTHQLQLTTTIAAVADSPQVAPLQNGKASPVDEDKDQMFPAICTKPKPLEPDPRKRKKPVQDLKHRHHAKVRKMANSSRSSSSNSKHHHNHHHSSSKKKHHKPISGAQAKKILDKFKIEMVEYVKRLLNSYRREECKIGRITNDDDFKFLAKKLSSNIIATEEKHCSSIENLSCNELVKKKAKKYVKSYMEKKRCPVYNREKTTETATETAEPMEAIETNEDHNDDLVEEDEEEEEEEPTNEEENLAHGTEAPDETTNDLSQ